MPVHQGKFPDFDKIGKAICWVTVKTPSGAIQGGTGTIIGKKGLLVTNHHVIAEGKRLPDTKQISVRKKCNSRFQIKKIECAESSDDMALLRIRKILPMKDFIPLRRKPIPVGERIWIIGFPQTSDGETLNRAITSGYVEEIDSVLGEIKTSATIGPGSSGSPIVDSNGDLVGVAHSSRKDNEDDLFSKSYGFTVDVIREALDDDGRS